MVTAEIMTIGDEILIGQIVDTNSAWLGELFSASGITVTGITSVPDKRERIIQALDQALLRVDVVVVTGGLGPTKDDITKGAIAEFLGVKLIRDEGSYRHVEAMLRERGIEFNESNRSQATLPEGCRVLRNDNGTAPGMCFERAGKLLFSLPGVPFEMKALVREQVIELIGRKFELRSVVHRTVMVFGVAESVLSEMIARWEDDLPGYLKLAYLPNPRGIRLRLSAYDVNRTEVESEIDRRLGSLRELIAPFYLGDEPSSVESSLAELLRDAGKTLAVAESCTGGSISARLTALEGASQFYIGGVTSYSNDVKVHVLGVAAEDIQLYGAVSQSVVEQMACRVRELMGADYAIATTGIAGSAGGTTEKPVGTVWMAIAYPGGVTSRMMRFGTLRHQNIERSATHAINMLRLHLLGLSESLQNTGML